MRYVLLAVAALATAPSCYGQCNNGRCQVAGSAGERVQVARSTSTSSWRTIDQVAPVPQPAPAARKAVPMPAASSVAPQKVVVTSVTRQVRSVAVASGGRAGCPCSGGGAAAGPVRKLFRVLVPHR